MARLTALVPALLVCALAARAEEPHSITVRGRGTVSVRPDKLILVLGATGKAEKASDAVAKLKTKVDGIKTELNTVLKDKVQVAAAIKDSGLSFGSGADQMQIMMGGGREDAAAEISVTTELEVTIPGVDKMQDEDLAVIVSMLIDKATEAGAEMKPPTNRYNPWMVQGAAGVYFGFTDYATQVEKAWDEAVKKARDRATSIASRLGCEIGSALKVRDLTQNEGAAKQANPYAAMMGMTNDEEGPKPKSSGQMDLSVEIEVEFELKKK